MNQNFSSMFDQMPMDIVETTSTGFFSQFHQPIADMVQSMIHNKDNSKVVNAYSICAAPLIVFAFESSVAFIASNKTLQKAIHDDKNSDQLAVDWANSGASMNSLKKRDLKSFFEQEGRLTNSEMDQINAVYLLRDAVAHTHMWIREEKIVGDGPNRTSSSTHAQSFQGSRTKPLRSQNPVLNLSNDPNCYGAEHIRVMIHTIDQIIDKAKRSPEIASRAFFDSEVSINGAAISFWKLWETLSTHTKVN